MYGSSESRLLYYDLNGCDNQRAMQTHTCTPRTRRCAGVSVFVPTGAHEQTSTRLKDSGTNNQANMRTCMCVCMHTYVPTHPPTHAPTPLRIETCIPHSSMDACIRTRALANIPTCVHAHTHIHAYITCSMHGHTCMHAHACKNEACSCMHTHNNTCMHTCMHASSCTHMCTNYIQPCEHAHANKQITIKQT